MGNEWVRIGEIEERQTVMNGKGRFDTVAGTSIRPFSGALVKIAPRVSPFNGFKLTPEHPVLCVRRPALRRGQIDKKELKAAVPSYVDAGDLKDGDYIVFRSNQEVRDNQGYSHEFCRLLGYYLSEGWVNSGGGRNRDGLNVSFAFHRKEKKYIDDVKNLSRMLFKRAPYSRTRDNVTELTICSKELGLRLINIAGKGATRKKLAEEVMLLPPEKQKEIIIGYLRGDAWYGTAPGGRHKLYRASTASLDLAIQMQEMIARTGHFASIYRKKTRPHNFHGRIIMPSGDQFVVSFQPKKEWSFTHRMPYGFLVPVDIEREQYEGPVCNFETASDVHSYLVRGFVVHNCGSKTPHFVKTYGFEGLHGRALPVATGIKLANHALTVIAVMGDGDGYGIGGGHFLHTLRRNLNMTLLFQNNEVYGLTKGQYSPTSKKGAKTPSSPAGALEDPVNPMALAIAGGATYVARGYAMDIMHLKKLIVDGIRHKGLSVIDILQPCSTYNKNNTMAWYQQNIEKIDAMAPPHNPADKAAAMALAMRAGGKIPVGLFYKEEGKPTYEDGVASIQQQPLVRHDIANVDITKLLERFM